MFFQKAKLKSVRKSNFGKKLSDSEKKKFSLIFQIKNNNMKPNVFNVAQ